MKDGLLCPVAVHLMVWRPLVAVIDTLQLLWYFLAHPKNLFNIPILDPVFYSVLQFLYRESNNLHNQLEVDILVAFRLRI